MPLILPQHYCTTIRQVRKCSFVAFTEEVLEEKEASVIDIRRTRSNSLDVSLQQSWRVNNGKQDLTNQQSEVVKVHKSNLIHFSAYAPALSRCGNERNMWEGKRIHAIITKNGHLQDKSVGNFLIEMYVRCGRLEAAYAVFDRMKIRNTFSWNTILGCYTNDGKDREALQLFCQLETEGTKPNKFTFSTILNACSGNQRLEEGRQLHMRIVDNGLDSNLIVATALIKMYGNCMSVEDAKIVFDKMLERDVVSWTTMISACVQNNCGQQALHLFDQMQLEGIVPTKITFISLFDACKSPSQGKRMHGYVITTQFILDIVVGTALINMYGKFGNLEKARKTFDMLPDKDAVTWNSVIAAYLQNNEAEMAFQFFQQMQTHCQKPNKVSFVWLFNTCGNLESLSKSKKAHAFFLIRFFDPDVIMENALISMYARCNDLKEANKIFRKGKKDLVAWNTMVAGYAQNNHIKDAFETFREMMLGGMKPDNITYLVILETCIGDKALAKAKWVHSHILGYAEDVNAAVANALVNVYGKCGSVGEAKTLFDTMGQLDLISWTSIMAAYAQNGLGITALQIFHQIQHAGMEHNNITFVSILNVCDATAALGQGKAIHASIIASEHEPCTSVGNALINMCSKCGVLDDARKVFDRLVERDVISWNVMIAACLQNDSPVGALLLWQEMESEELIPDEVTFVSVLDASSRMELLPKGKRIHAHVLVKDVELNILVGNALINMYGKCGSLEEAEISFSIYPERNAISWNTMVTVYAQNGHIKEAVALFHKVKEVISVNIGLISIFDACARFAALEDGKDMHAHIVEHGMELDLDVSNAIINMYCKCGSLEEAKKIFYAFPEKDIVSWNAMIAGYAQNGLGKEAIELFCQMYSETVSPNKVTCVSVLSACSHSGLVDEGCHYFVSVHFERDIILALEHYSALCDILARVGWLVEAYDMINQMHFLSTSMLWTSLVAASRIHGHLDIRNAGQVLILDSHHAGTYILLSNIYAAENYI